MNKQTIDIQIIEDYLTGQWDQQIMEEIELRIQEDPEFAKNVIAMKAIIKSAKELARNRFLVGLNKTQTNLKKTGFLSKIQDNLGHKNDTDKDKEDPHRERFLSGLKKAQENLTNEGFFDDPTSIKKPKYRKILLYPLSSIAATIVLIIISLNFFFPSNQSRFSYLFEMNTEPVKNAVSNVGFISLDNRLLNIAILEIEKGELKEAENTLQKFLTAKPVKFYADYGYFLLAQVYLKTDQHALARPLLEDLAEDQIFEEYETTNWFLGLLYLYQDQGAKSTIPV